MEGNHDRQEQHCRKNEVEMQQRVASGAEPGAAEVRVGITRKQTCLIKNQAGIPHRRASTEERQDHLRDHRFNNEQQRRIDEQSYREDE